MDVDLPKHIQFWMTSSSKHDCFFEVGAESDGRERIGAIKILLIGHSEVLRYMWEESPIADTGDISVPDSDAETFKRFLICVYGGVNSVVKQLSFEKCLNLLYLCEKYLALDVKENLSSSFLELYHQSLSADDMLMALSKYEWLMNCVKCKTIDNNIKMSIQLQTEEIFEHKLFSSLSAKAVELIVKQETLSTEEINVWKAMLNWGQKEVDFGESKDLRSCLRGILPHIRFCTMEVDQFCKSVIPSNVLLQEEVFEICKSIVNAEVLTVDGLCCERSARKIVTSGTSTRSVSDIKCMPSLIGLDAITLTDFRFYITLTEENGSFNISLMCYDCKRRSTWSCYVKFEITIRKTSGYDVRACKTICQDFNYKARFWKDEIASKGNFLPCPYSNRIDDPIVIFVTGKILSQST